MGIGAARAEIIKNRHLDIEEAIGFEAGGSMGRFREEVCTGGAQAAGRSMGRYKKPLSGH